MPTRNVVLTDHHEKLITELVASGRYQNASEILRDGLRLVEERDARQVAKLDALKAAAKVGSDAISRGEYREFASFEDMESDLLAVTDAAIIAASPRKE